MGLRPQGALWHNGDFLCLWSGQTISQFGSQVTQLALPLAAILVLRATTFEVAALGVVEMLPFVLFSLPAGVWVDRLRRRPILIAADCGRALALGSIPLAYVLGELTLGQIYAVGFLAGLLTVFFDVAYQSYLPSLVERGDIGEGNSKLEFTRSTAGVAGPGLAGILVGALRAPYAILLDAASFVVSALFLARIRREETARERVSGHRPRMRTEIAEGLRYVLRHPFMRPSILFVAISNFFTTLIFSIVLVYAVRQLHLSPATIGLTFTLGSIGSLLGAVAATRLTRRFGIGKTLIGAATNAWALVLIPLASGSLAIPFLVVAQFVFALGSVIYNITAITLSQAITPDRMLGRMTASRRFVVWGVIPLGGLLGGALGSHVGLRETLWIGAIGASLAFVPLILSPIRTITSTEDAEVMAQPHNDALLLRAQAEPNVASSREG